MRLRDWLRHGQREELAQLVGCSVGQLTCIATGLRKPSIDLAERISLATDGKVTVKELMVGNRKLHTLIRWSDNDPVATPGEVATYELQELMNRSATQADAPAPAPIQEERAR